MQQAEPEQLTLFDLGPDMAKLRRNLAALKRLTRAKSTLEAYESTWRLFTAWCTATGRKPLPATAETLTLYVVARLEAGAKITSAERHIAAIAFMHRREGKQPPDRTEARTICAGARRSTKEQPKQRTPLTPTDLRKICDRLTRDNSAIAARDRAILTLGFASGLRRSNLAALNLADLRFVPRRGVAVTVRSSKTDQTGHGQIIGVFFGRRAETCPVRAVRHWLTFRGQEPGALFTSRRNGQEGTPLDPETINRIVKAAVQSIGLDPTNYGGHSLRSACVTAAHNGGAGTLAIMERTGHKSVEMVRRYLRNADPFAGANPMRHAL